MAFEIPFFSKKKKDLSPQEAAPEASQADVTPIDLAEIAPGMTALEIREAALRDRKFDVRLPLIGHRPRRWQERFLMTILFFAIVFSIVFALAQWQRSHLTNYQTQLTSNLQRNHQQMILAAGQTVQGASGAINQLETQYQSFQKNWVNLQALHQGQTTAGVAETGGGRSAYEASPQLLDVARKVSQVWASTDPAVRTILSYKDDMTAYASSMQRVRSLSAATPKQLEDVANVVLKNSPSTSDSSTANQLRSIAQRLERGKNDVLTADGVNADLALSMGRDLNNARHITEGFLLGGNPERLSGNDPKFRADLTRLQNVLSGFQQALSSVVGSQHSVAAAKQQSAANAIRQ